MRWFSDQRGAKGRVTAVLFTLWHVFKRDCVFLFFFQNILKRTTPGSRDEDTATKAFNELKKVIIIFNNPLDEVLPLAGRCGNNHAGMHLLDHQRMQLQRAVDEEDGGAHSPQQENPFRGKSERSTLFGSTSLASVFLLPPSYSAAWCSPFPDLSSDLSVPLAGEARWAPGGGHADDEHVGLKAEAAHQTCVPPPVQWLSPAVQEEGVSDMNHIQRDREPMLLLLMLMHIQYKHCTNAHFQVFYTTDQPLADIVFSQSPRTSIPTKEKEKNEKRALDDPTLT